MTDEMPSPKPLKKCTYCYDECKHLATPLLNGVACTLCGKDVKRDALWTVTYLRELAHLDKTLKVRDMACDLHLATACSRASRRLRVYPRFLVGPGGMRVMPNGVVPAAGGGR